MPTYEYECKDCSHEFEIFQSMKDDTLKTCPECKEDTLKRKIGTGAGIIFKGDGFYCTDYRSDSYKKAAESDKKAPSEKSETKSEKKSETKKSSEPVKKAS
jgi:putative FmdB family regulatory protein